MSSTYISLTAIGAIEAIETIETMGFYITYRIKSIRAKNIVAIV